MKPVYTPIKLLLIIIILISIIPSLTTLSFTYPQSTTLKNKNILIVEKNGIFICNENFTNILSTVYTFSEEDKISSESQLSKTIIRKSSIFILIFTSFKIYVLDTNTGVLLYNNDTKLITDDEPDHVTVAYSYSGDTFYFIIGYIDQNNYLKIQYYQLFNSDSGCYIEYYTTISKSSVTRTYSGNSLTFQFLNKGLSCERIIDSYSSSYSWVTCFLIAKSTQEYLIPVNAKISGSTITFENVYNKMDYIIVNNTSLIKSDTSGSMQTAYVCYATTYYNGICYKFQFNKYYSDGLFYSLIDFGNNCRADIYGMKVSYLFENGDIILSCSNTDGSIKAYSVDDAKIYNKFEGCTSIYGYSIIYSSYKENLYVTSDVVCPNGIIPYTILKNKNDTEYLIENKETVRTESTITYIKEITDKISEEIKEDSTFLAEDGKKGSTIITEQIKEDSTIFTEQIKEDSTSLIGEIKKDSTIITQIIIPDTTYLTEKINKVNTENIEEKNDCPEMCLECNSEKKCTKCNQNKGYYPIELSSTSPTLKCLNETLKNEEYPEFYLDTEVIGNEIYKPCYERCASCYGKGDGNDQNYKTCDSGYILHPEYINSKDCVPEPNPYYYIQYGQYTTTNSERCPDDFSYLIPQKNKCIENCEKDNIYQYTYDDICYDGCPENSAHIDGGYICKDDPNKCIYTKKVLFTLNEKITKAEIEALTSKYAKEYDYTNNHISLYENNIYIINIYKNGNCLTELGLSTKKIDFGVCYDKVQNKLSEKNPINTNLIIVNIKTKPGKEEYEINPSYGLYNPINGSTINLEEECKDDKVTIQNNITEEFNNSKVSLDTISKMAEQGIDLFDLYSPFYNDLCTHYPSIGKDVPLKKRILAYYPDIDLCDDNCDLLGIFLDNMTAKCECSLFGKENIKNGYKDNSLYQKEVGPLEEFIYMTNINVIKCYEGVFEYKYFIKSYGGFIIIGLIVIQIACTILYFWKSRFYLKKYIFSITNRYLNFLNTKNPLVDIDKKDFKPYTIKANIEKIVNPPRKMNKAPTGIGPAFKDLSNSKNPKNKILNKNNVKSTNNIIIYSNNSNEKISSKPQRQRSKTFKKRRTNMKEYNALSRNSLKNNNFTHKLSYEQSINDNLMINIKDDFDVDMKEFLKTDPDDMDYDDALRRDKRTFCGFYSEKIQSEQMLINTFFHREYLKPIPIKIILLMLQIDLYFFINALFYNEEYVEKIFELEEDSFSQAIWRFLDNLFYAFMVGVIINYIIEFFFIQEKKLRVTLKREKDNLLILKYEMMQIIKDIEKRYLYFIIISFIILCFTWYHLSCFNHVYPHMQKEWLIFSSLIIVCIQLLSLLTSLLETIIRFLSFRFKNEKLFKLSLLFS